MNPGVSVTSSYSVIVQVSAVMKTTIVGGRRFVNLSGSHLQIMLFVLLSVIKGELQKLFQ